MRQEKRTTINQLITQNITIERHLEIKINKKKCKVMHYGKRNWNFEYKVGRELLENSNLEKG